MIKNLMAAISPIGSHLGGNGISPIQMEVSFAGKMKKKVDFLLPGLITGGEPKEDENCSPECSYGLLSRTNGASFQMS